MNRLDPATSLLLVVDMQEKLAAAMPPPMLERVVANAVILLETARVLGVHVVASEQYPRGLGTTIARVGDELRALGVAPVDKLTFDASAEPRIARAIGDRAPHAVVLIGMEAHICVFQTARELVRRGVDVRVVADAVASRSEENRVLGMSLCEHAGAFAMPTEAVAFDWLAKAGTEEFRAVSKLVR